MILLLGTQIPDKDSLSTGITRNVNTRFCLSVADQTANDMILGTSAYRQSYRATVALPAQCVHALKLHGQWQADARDRAGKKWQETGLVFTSALGTALDAANVRRALRRVVKAAGLDPGMWTPRELRHTFVSIASDLGLTLEQIADLVGHAGTVVTEKVYRHQLRPVLRSGAEVMDQLFVSPPGSSAA